MAKNNLIIQKINKILENKEDVIELISTRDRIIFNILIKAINNTESK